MKKMAGLKVSMAALLLAIMLVLPIKGYAGWVLYDDFRSSNIDWSLWDRYGDWTSRDSERYIDNERLKIIFKGGPDPESRYGLRFTQHVEELKAIRAKVTIADCTGDCRARIKTDWQLDDGVHAFQQGINIYGNEEIENKFNGYLLLYLQATNPPPGRHLVDLEKCIRFQPSRRYNR